LSSQLLLTVQTVLTAKQEVGHIRSTRLPLKVEEFSHTTHTLIKTIESSPISILKGNTKAGYLQTYKALLLTLAISTFDIAILESE